MRLSNISYYTQTPIISLNKDLIVEDTNLAFMLFFEQTYRGQSITDLCQNQDQSIYLRKNTESLIERLKTGLKNHIGKELNLHERQAYCVDYSSSQYGSFHFTLRVQNVFDFQTGDANGIVIYFDYESLRDDTQFHSQWAYETKRHYIWDRYSFVYDRFVTRMPYYIDVKKRHVDALSTQRDVKTVLDVGAGTGEVTVELLRAGMHVTAVDFSRSMLELLLSKMDGFAANRDYDILEQNAERLENLSDRQFDGLTILLALFDMNDPRKALTGSVRLLRPGGTIVITEPLRKFDRNHLFESIREEIEGKFETNSTQQNDLKKRYKQIEEINAIIDPTKRNGERTSSSEETNTGRIFIEDIQNILMDANCEVLEIKPSHFGNCATLYARKR